MQHLRDTTFESLKIRDFRVLWYGFLGSWTGMQFQQVARGYLAYKLTGSAFAIGVVTLAIGLPRVVLSPVGGWLADRFDKRSVLVWASMAMAALSVLTAALYVVGALTITVLVVLGLLQGVAFALLMPARQAYTPQIVGSNHLIANAVALNNAGMNLTRVAGPAVAGILIATPHIGLGGTFFLIGACWVWVTTSTWQVHNPGASVGVRQKMTASVRDGFSYVRRRPGLLALMSLGFVPLALGMPYINLMPAVADGTLHGGSTLLGVLLSVGGVGSLAGTLLVATLAHYEKKATMQLVFGVAFGLALVGFGFFVRRGDLLASFPFLFLAGTTGDAYQALNASMTMMSTEPGHYGRVMGVYMIAQSIRPISVMPIGALGDEIGVPVTLMAAGAIVTMFVAGVAALYPGYRSIAREPAGGAVEADETAAMPAPVAEAANGSVAEALSKSGSPAAGTGAGPGMGPGMGTGAGPGTRPRPSPNPIRP